MLTKNIKQSNRTAIKIKRNNFESKQKIKSKHHKTLTKTKQIIIMKQNSRLLNKTK